MRLDDIYVLKPSQHGKYKTDPDYCRLHGITRRQHSRTVRKWLNYESIGDWYDVGTSVNDNYRYAKENGIKVSLNTLKRFCTENKIDLHPEKRAIGEWYNVNLSVRKNLEWAKEHGIKVSQRSLYNYCRVHGIGS